MATGEVLEHVINLHNSLAAGKDEVVDLVDSGLKTAQKELKTAQKELKDKKTD